MNFISIQVPVYKYLKKFAETRYANHNNQIMVSTAKSPGIVMWKILTRKNYRPFAMANSYYNANLEFLISERFYNNSGFFLSPENTFIFNRYLRHQFEESLFDHITINAYCGFSNNIENQILTYLDYYNITESERSLESILKKYQRWRCERKVCIEKI
jgi:hypothetical protein